MARRRSGREALFLFVWWRSPLRSERVQFFPFRLRRTDILEVDGRDTLELTMDVDSFLLRWLVDPVVLLYSEERRLLEYRGITNIRDDEGDMIRARIVFDYPEG